MFDTPTRERSPIGLIVSSGVMFLMVMVNLAGWLTPRSTPFWIFWIGGLAVALVGFYVGIREVRRREKARDEQQPGS